MMSRKESIEEEPYQRTKFYPSEFYQYLEAPSGLSYSLLSSTLKSLQHSSFNRTNKFSNCIQREVLIVFL